MKFSPTPSMIHLFCEDLQLVLLTPLLYVGSKVQSFIFSTILYYPTTYSNWIDSITVVDSNEQAVHIGSNKIHLYHRGKFWLVFPNLYLFSSPRKIIISHLKVKTTFGGNKEKVWAQLHNIWNESHLTLTTYHHR